MSLDVLQNEKPDKKEESSFSSININTLFNPLSQGP